MAAMCSGQAVAADVFLPDDQQVDAAALGFLADVAGAFHVGGVDRAVHAEAVEYPLGLLDQASACGTGMNWDRSVLPSL